MIIVQERKCSQDVMLWRTFLMMDEVVIDSLLKTVIVVEFRVHWFKLVRLLVSPQWHILFQEMTPQLIKLQIRLSIISKKSMIQALMQLVLMRCPAGSGRLLHSIINANGSYMWTHTRLSIRDGHQHWVVVSLQPLKGSLPYLQVFREKGRRRVGVSKETCLSVILLLMLCMLSYALAS